MIDFNTFKRLMICYYDIQFEFSDYQPNEVEREGHKDFDDNFHCFFDSMGHFSETILDLLDIPSQNDIENISHPNYFRRGVFYSLLDNGYQIPNKFDLKEYPTDEELKELYESLINWQKIHSDWLFDYKSSNNPKGARLDVYRDYKEYCKE